MKPQVNPDDPLERVPRERRMDPLPEEPLPERKVLHGQAAKNAARCPMDTLTPRQLEILQHALGVDQYGRGQMYRNHFCAGGKDEDTCKELVAMGFMATFTRSYLPYYNCTVTDTGKSAMLQQSPKNRLSLTRSQQRYRRFLKADTGESFGDWLKWDREAL